MAAPAATAQAGGRRARAVQASVGEPPAAGPAPEKLAEVEAVRGYFAERERLFKLYEDQRKTKEDDGKP